MSIFALAVRRLGKSKNIDQKENDMRFLAYTLGQELPMEPPSPELMQQMDQLVEDATKAGVMIATGGVAPLADKTVVSLSDGQLSVANGPFTDGPYAEAKELVGGWALLEVRDKDEAIEWTRRFLAIVGGGETILRQTFGPEDVYPGFETS
jgi:hypothetical protein